MNAVQFECESNAVNVNNNYEQQKRYVKDISNWNVIPIPSTYNCNVKYIPGSVTRTTQYLNVSTRTIDSTFNKDKVTTFNKDKVTPFSNYKVAPLTINDTTLIHLKVILFKDTSSANTTLNFKVTALNIKDISKIQQRTNMILQITQQN